VQYEARSASAINTRHWKGVMEVSTPSYINRTCVPMTPIAAGRSFMVAPTMPRIMTCGNTMSSSPVNPLLFLGLKYHVDFRLYSTLSSSSRSTRSTFHLYSLQQMFDLVKILLNLGQIYENPRKFSCRGLKLELIKLKWREWKLLEKCCHRFWERWSMRVIKMMWLKKLFVL